MKMKNGDIIEITWLDAWSNSHGYFEDNYEYQSMTIKDVGYFMQENEHGVTMVRSMGTFSKNRGETFTPWEMILGIEVLV